MSSPRHVEILLATFEGAPFLEEQLESLLAQTHAGWTLLARDDGSTDGTPAILERYANRHAGRIRVLPSDGRRLGAAGNFSALLEASAAPYVAFCDQDDVWLPDKLEATLAAMAALEERRGAACPLLVHTDVRVVDERLRPLGDSLWRYHGTDPGRLSVLPRLLLQNVVTGCTAMANRALVSLARPIPPEARMHDWWLALVAAAFGAVGAVPRPTLLYRQHRANELGARRFQLLGEALGLLDPARRRETSARRTAEIRRLEAQAAAFLERFGERLPAEARATVAAFATLSRQGFLARRARIVRHGFYYSNPAMTAAMLLFR